MYSVETNKKQVGGVPIETFSRRVFDGCDFMFEVGTNGYKGGNSAHGSRTYIDIKTNVGSEFITFKNQHTDVGEREVTICAGGDSELYCLLTGLKFVVQVLEDQIKGVKD